MAKSIRYKCCLIQRWPILNTSALQPIKKAFRFACILKRNNYLYCVLISPNLGLPWKCENTGTKNYRVIDFYILFIVDWVGECMDFSSLKQNREHRKWSSPLCWSGGEEQKVNAIMILQLKYRLRRLRVAIKLTSSTIALRVASMRVRPSLSALTRWYDPFTEDSWTSKYSEGKPVSIRTFWKIQITHTDFQTSVFVWL